MITVYAKVEGKLAQWEFEGDDYVEALEAVHEALPAAHSGAIMARIK